MNKNVDFWFLSLGYPWGMVGVSLGEGSNPVRKRARSDSLEFGAKVVKKNGICKYRERKKHYRD